MKIILNEYLEKMEKYLKPVAVAERVDIIKEIKSEMQELQCQGVPAEQIIERLGNPKDLARSYLGDLLSKDSDFNFNKFLIVCAFYGLVGFSGLWIIPTLAISSPVFIASGGIVAIIATIKMINGIFHLGIPWMANSIIFDGVLASHPIIEFLAALVIGILLYFIGRGLWKLLLYYCKMVSKTKKRLSI